MSSDTSAGAQSEERSSIGDFSGLWDQLVAAHNEVMEALPINVGTIREAWEQPGVLDGVRAFIDAVDWSELFFLYLLTFHVVIYFGVIAFSWGSTNRTAIAMVLLFVMVLTASTLNDLGAQHHEQLFADAKTNYFDPNGIFVSAVYVAPLLLLALALQLKMFWNLFLAMVSVKRVKLRHEARQKQQQQPPKGPAAGGPSAEQKGTKKSQ